MEAPARRLLIAGCGDLGQRLAGRLNDWQVHGLKRNPDSLSPLIVPLKADLGRPDTLSAAAGHWEGVIYTATPGERTPEGYRRAYVEGLKNLLDRVSADRLIMVSSTAVFGQDAGEWVSESSPAIPQRFNGRILLEAEQLAREAGATVLRFSGIYGPGRDYLIRKVRAGGVRCQRRPPVWTNRIHAEDCAAALAHVLKMSEPEALYVASDALPAPRWDVLCWLARQLGAELPVQEDDAEASGQGKRVSSAKLASTGFALQYPDYQAGYRSLLK